MDRHQELFDRADNDQAYENAIQLERERALYDALEEAVAKGLSKESLRVLAMESGMTTWAIKQSLKSGPQSFGPGSTITNERKNV